MTQEEMLARIAELEEENAKLRHTKYKVSLYDEFRDVYPWIRGLDTNLLSKLIRSTCFHKYEKDHLHTWYDGEKGVMKYTYVLQTKDMTDEQRKMFKKIAGEVLEVLSKYEVLSKEE